MRGEWIKYIVKIRTENEKMRLEILYEWRTLKLYSKILMKLTIYMEKNQYI